MILLVSVAMAVGILATAGMAWAQADPPLNETPDNTWMTNGAVNSVVRSGDYIYVGGKFTRARSAVSGGKSFVATNLARFDADTGVGDPTWTPDVTGADTSTTVWSLAATDGKIWVGGKFNAVDGIARRNLAAISEQTGVVDPNVDPVVGSETSQGVRALLASDTKVYLGGYFTTIDDKGHRFLGALDLSGDPDPTWKPKTDGGVHTLAFSADKATVFAGGAFDNAAGPDAVYSPRMRVARFDANTGALDPWTIPVNTVENGDVANDMAVTPDRLTVTFRGSNWTRSLRLDNGSTGTQVWSFKSPGEGQTLSLLPDNTPNITSDDKIIIGGHFSSWQREKRTGIAMINLSNGSVDMDWNPVLTAGGTSFVSVLETYVDGNHVYVGGKFNSVEGQPRTNFVRFSRDVPDTTNPTVRSVTPADGATDVALDTNVVANFSEAIDPATITNATFTLTDPGATSVPAAVSYDPATQEATLVPSGALQPTTAYTATLKGGSGGVKDLAGNALDADVIWSFTTSVQCTINGTPNADTLTGTSGDDVICAGAGNDIIQGLEGDDTIKGEAGVDTASYSNSLAAITASLASGSASGEGSDTLVGIENITGSANADDLGGSDGNNRLSGGGGADNLNGLAGADKLTGGAGDDTLDSQDGVEGNDTVDGGGGTDTCTTDATETSILNCEQ
jgi:Ca2+-binding RTX toxin-like protein